MGQCPSCQAWNSLEEKVEIRSSKSVQKKNYARTKENPKAQTLGNLQKGHLRFTTCFSEFNRLLGGGMVSGSVILLGGEPGVGKSTLLLSLARSAIRILYVSGEESLAQIGERAKRLEIATEKNLPDNLFLLHENHLEKIFHVIQIQKAQLVFIDSIQTVYAESGRAFSGSVSQIRESTQFILEYAKSKGVTFLLTGHITKDGQIAGPKLLEHAVDVVLYFENYRYGQYRFLRSVKNRFGSTGEVAFFEMNTKGLREISPEKSLLSLEETGGVGSALFLQMEGSRVLPLEVQVLVTPAGYSNGRRIGENIDVARIHLIAAILEKFVGYRLSQTDIYVRVMGGMYLNDQAGDLPLLMAMASSYNNIALPPSSAYTGEVSLTGQIRNSAHLQSRLKAAQNLNLGKIVIGGKKHSSQNSSSAPIKSNIEELYFDDVEKLIKAFFSATTKNV